MLLPSETLIEDATLDTKHCQYRSDSQYVEALDVTSLHPISLDASVMPCVRI